MTKEQNESLGVEIMSIQIQRVGRADCDACPREECQCVLVEVNNIYTAESFLLCSHDRKRLAAMLLDRTTWYKPTPLKPGETLMA